MGHICSSTLKLSYSPIRFVNIYKRDVKTLQYTFYLYPSRVCKHLAWMDHARKSGRVKMFRGQAHFSSFKFSKFQVVENRRYYISKKILFSKKALSNKIFFKMTCHNTMENQPKIKRPTCTVVKKDWMGGIFLIFQKFLKNFIITVDIRM